MEQYGWIVWAVAMVLFAIVEAATVNLVSVWFVGGSLVALIVHLLGGRVAESLTLDDISTGASNDIQRATDIARDMVTKYGFSERIGTVNYSNSEEVFLGNDFTTHKNYSDEVAREIDDEVKKIISSMLSIE